MRLLSTLGLLAVCLAAGPVSQQRAVTIKFTFDSDPRPSTRDPSEVGNVLALRSALRAWTDSVDVFLDQVAIGARERGWARVRPDEKSNYLVTITALPVLNPPTGMTVYSLVLFKASYGSWQYTTNYVGYSSRAQQAAEGIFRAATDGINAERSK